MARAKIDETQLRQVVRSPRVIRQLAEVDWDFSAQFSGSAFSPLHWHPCRFPSQIPAIAIARLSPPSGFVVDPFMGSATTLVEAQRLGRNSVGIDVNPISCLIARAKTLPAEAYDLRRYVTRQTTEMLAKWDNLPAGDIPDSVQREKWYMPATLRGLAKIWNFIRHEDDPHSVVMRAAFSSILLSACRETRHWGYVCDNSEPKSYREPDPKGLFSGALEKFCRAYEERDELRGNGLGDVDVVEGNALESLRYYESERFDLLVTSPPYFGVADYVKAQRLSMEWFGLNIEPLRRNEVGARSKRHRRNAQSEYFQDIREVFSQSWRILRPGAFAVVVYGQSPARADTHQEFVDTLKTVGFSLELFRKRQIAVTRRQMPSLADEMVLVLRKG